MRVVFWSGWVLLLLAGCSSGDPKGGQASAQVGSSKIDSLNRTTVQWLDSANRNFGKIAEGQVLQIAYRFKNTGQKPLVIQRVQPSCGCTIAEQPDKPILPGEEGVIKASFDSEHHVGINHKTLYVYANIQRNDVCELQFSVEVEKKKW